MTLLFQIADDPKVGSQINAWGTGETLDSLVVTRVEALVMAYVRHLENAHYQMEEGTLRPEFLENWASNPSLGLPYFREFWERRRNSFGQAFRDYLEERLSL
jgi:hypothetical protein